MSEEQNATAVEQIVSEDALIAMMRRLAEAKRHLEEQKARAAKYLEQIKTEIAEDLAPMEREIEWTRRAIRAYLIEERGGESFKVPGLGSAGITRRRQTKIVDAEAFVKSVRDANPDALASLYDEPKLSLTKSKKYAESVLHEVGEIIPGTDTEEIQTLQVRLSGGAS